MSFIISAPVDSFSSKTIEERLYSNLNSSNLLIVSTDNEIWMEYSEKLVEIGILESVTTEDAFVKFDAPVAYKNCVHAYDFFVLTEMGVFRRTLYKL